MPAPAPPTDFAVANSAIPYPDASLSRRAFKRALNKAGVKLTWTPTPSAEHRIEKSAGGGDWDIASVTGESVGSEVVEGLSKNDAWKFRIRAQNGEGFSSWVTLNFNTPSLATSDAPPLSPTGLAVDQITHKRAGFTWIDNAANEAFYELTLRQGNVMRRTRFDPFEPEAVVDISALFIGQIGEVGSKTFTAVLRAVGGKGTAKKWPHVFSATSAEIAFTLLPPAIKITRVIADPIAFTAREFTATIHTDQPPTGVTATGLPDGLTLNTATWPATITGITSAAAGDYPVAITATNASGSDVEPITIKVVESRIEFSNPPAVLAAVVGIAFSATLSTAAIGCDAVTSFTVENLPSWLTFTRNGAAAILAGTPIAPGEWSVLLTASNGVQSATATVRVVAPAVVITSPETATGYTGQFLSIDLAALPPHAEFTGEDMPEWLGIYSQRSGENSRFSWLAGTPEEEGEFTFTLTAAVEEGIAHQDFTLTVFTLIEGPSSIDIDLGVEVTEGPFIYLGAGEVQSWVLVGAPEGLSITSDLSGVSGYANLDRGNNVAFIIGAARQTGIFEAKVVVLVRLGGKMIRYEKRVIIYVSGGLFVAWLHVDRTLYDLQVQIRGDIVRRKVESFYQRSALPSGKTVSTTTTKDGENETVTTTASEHAATPGNLLTLKRGDSARLAVLIRDGREVLTAGISDVGFGLRLPDSADEEYVFQTDAVPTALNGSQYFAVSFEVTSELLEEVQGDDGLSPVETLGELFWTYKGLKYSSATFHVTIAEDVVR